MTDTNELTALRLSLAVVNIDLQLYKGSIYKLRWGTPGGIDQALPCYDEATRVLRDTPWPPELRPLSDTLRDRVAAYRETLVKKDVTSASAESTRMMRAFEALREGARTWPNAAPAITSGGASAADGPDQESSMDTPMGEGQSILHAGMEPPGA
jgi:hypothetical protein